jgi:hypothetical protein
VNNQPPLKEPLPLDEAGGAATFTPAWQNWFQQIFLCLGWTKAFNVTKTIDFASVAAYSQQSSSQTVTGARSGDAVLVTPIADVTGLIFTGVVTGRDAVTVYAKNFTAGAIDPASQVFRIVVIQN